MKTYQNLAIRALTVVAVSAAVVAANAGLKPTLMAAKSETVVEPSAIARVPGGRVTDFSRVSPVDMREYHAISGQAKNAANYKAAYNSYLIADGAVTPSTTSTTIYGSGSPGSYAFSNTYMVWMWADEMKFNPGTQGKAVRYLVTGCQHAYAGNLAVVINPVYQVDQSGFGPAVGYLGDGVLLSFDAIAAGFHRLSTNFGTSDLQVSVPADSNGYLVRFLQYDGSASTGRTNYRALPAGSGASPAYRHNLCPTDPVYPGTNPSSSNQYDWEDQIDPTWNGTGTFTNLSDYIFEDGTDNAALGADNWAEVFDNTLSDTSILHPAISLLTDTNIREIRGQVTLNAVTPGTEPEVVFVEVNAKANLRMIPLVPSGTDNVFNYTVLDTNQVGTGGSRDLWFKVDTWLGKKITVDTTAGTVTGANVSLTNGDCNSDNIVDSSDYFILSDAYDTASTDAAYNYQADLNRDDVVDSSDYFILSDAYDLVGDDELP